MNTQCAVTNDLNRFLAVEDRAEAYAEFLEKRTEELMQEGQVFYPFSEQNFCEALSESNLSEIAWLFQQGMTAIAGLKTSLVVNDYWKKLANSKAETEAETECRKCFGAGCRHCNEEPNEYED